MTSISSFSVSRLHPGASCSGRHHHSGPLAFNATLVQHKVTRRGVPFSALHALDADFLQSLHDVVQHIPIAYERVVYPCSSVNCGDIIHRSTLDPALRMEDAGINPLSYVLLGIATLYLTSSPGVLQGFIDQYVVTPFLNVTRPQLTSKGVEIGKKLATGGFGTVFLGKATTTVPGQIKKGQTIIVKRATEFGEAEVWMNERLSRAAPQACAKYLTAYADGPPSFGTPLVLVWKYEGRNTLDDLMLKPDFPYNCESALFGRELRISDPTARKLASIKLLMEQMLENLAAIHSTGIVHRDIKPQNMILSESEGRLKMIDLGAAADLRVGINYVPNEYLLDPRFAPPQQYVMSPLTPKAPPAPVAAFLSPVLWRLNQPDRFDMYSVGIVMLQLMFPCLRKDDNLVAFNSKLEAVQYDLREWRRSLDSRTLARDYQDGFNILDTDDQAGWSLLCKLVTFKPGERYSAGQALRHRWFDDPNSMSLLKRVATLADQTLDNIDSEGTMARTLMGNRDLISEAQIFEELELDNSKAAPEIPRDMPRTIAWWQQRMVEKKVKAKANDAFSGLGNVFGQVLAPKEGRNGGGFGTQRAFGPAASPPRAQNGANGNGAKNSVDEEDSTELVPAKAAAKPSNLLSIFDKFR